MRRTVERLIADALTVDDLIQQTFLSAHRARRSCLIRTGLTDDAVLAWFKTIARNAARSHLRRVYRRPRRDEEHVDELPAPEDDAETRIVAEESQARLRHSLATGLSRLSPRLREVVVMHKVEGIPLSEVSRRLGIRASTARVRAHRAYAALREGLQ